MIATDVVVLGGGPSGCAVATVLARAGRDVLIVDRLRAPAAAVGESLLPFGTRVLEEMGVSMEGFQVKRGAVFTRGDDSVRFAFSEAVRPTWPSAWEVRRDVFDQRLRDVARQAGARFHHARAERFEPGVLHTDGGQIHCELFVDAAGRRKFLARQRGEVEHHPVLRNAAQSAHHADVDHLVPAVRGDITICRFVGGWFWFIPFADETTSVGLVTSPECRLGRNRWAAALARCPQAARRLARARRLSPLSGVENFTSYAARFHGPGWALAGDAALFLDPVFSSGVLLALESAWTLGEVIRDGGDLDFWEAGLRAAVVPMEKAVLAFYDGSFMDVACAGYHKPRYRRQITSLLAGDLFAPGNEISRRMADKFGWLAGLVGQVETR